jgi:hypothetical protein
MQVTSCVRRNKNTLQSLQKSSKAFLLIQNVRVLEKYFFQNSQEQVSEVAWWQEQEGELKFQQSNSSSKNGSENE